MYIVQIQEITQGFLWRYRDFGGFQLALNHLQDLRFVGKKCSSSQNTSTR